MPAWLIQAAESVGLTKPSNTLQWFTPCGSLCSTATEARHQCVARGTYTWGQGYCVVPVNTCTVATTIRSRKNGGNGNQVITIPALTAGVFPLDAVATDALVAGDSYYWQISSPAGAGNITITLVSSTLTSAANIPVIMATNPDSQTVAFGVTRYMTLAGSVRPSAILNTASYRMRTASLLSNLGIYLTTNTLNGNAVFTIMNAGLAGNETLTFGAGVAGYLEDVVNNDAIAAGTLTCLRVVTTAAGAGLLQIAFTSLLSTSLVRHCSNGNADAPGTQYGVGLTRYLAIEGDSQSASAALLEASVQSLCLVPFTAKNAYAYVSTNTRADATTLKLMRNGVATGVLLTIGAGVTGIIEDLVNTYNFVAGDLIDWELVTGAGAGNMSLQMVGFEQHQTAVPASGSVVPLCVAAGMF